MIFIVENKKMKFWFRKKVFAALIVAFVAYLMFRLRKFDVSYTAVVPHVQPVELWEFVSDFGNMQKLNPTITNFIIEADSGNHDHWKYQVYYMEYLSQIPYLTNFAWADFEVKILEKNTYAVYSKHKTCFLTSLLCVNTDSSFIIRPTRNPTECEYTEEILYECPSIFSSFCKREVLHQRETIRDNLIKHFERKAAGNHQ